MLEPLKVMLLQATTCQYQTFHDRKVLYDWRMREFGEEAS